MPNRTQEWVPMVILILDMHEFGMQDQGELQSRDPATFARLDALAV